MSRFLVGGYTSDADGNATGIGLLRAGAGDAVLAGGELRLSEAVTTGGSPSWVAPHPSLDVVYAALESDGTVQAFRRVSDERFARLGAPAPAGAAVCHVGVAPDGASLIASCWGDGRVVRMTLDAGGTPHAPVVAAAATDPYGPARDAGEEMGDPEEQEETEHALAAAARSLRAAAGPEYAHLIPDFTEAPPGQEIRLDEARPSRAHQARFLPGGLIATTDMGLDLVRFWRASNAGLRQVQQIVLPLGSGPRHMRWHPSGHLYVVTELSREILALAPEASGSWRVIAGASLADGVGTADAAAEITLSRDGDFAYVGLRGTNTIAVLRVRGNGAQFAPAALVDSGVDWPRHHVIVRDSLLVAGQRSDDVVTLSLDERTGIPGPVRRRITAPSPTCLLPLR